VRSIRVRPLRRVLCLAQGFGRFAFQATPSFSHYLVLDLVYWNSLMNEQTNRESQSTLYRELLGGDWTRAAPAVQAAHRVDRENAASGQFIVRWGVSPMARCVGRVCGFPRPSETTAVTLFVGGARGGEVWVRSFAGKRLVTRQSACGDHLLHEQIGMLAFRFRVRVTDDGGLVYDSEEAWLRCGRAAVRLPDSIAPHVNATEVPETASTGTRVTMDLTLPWVGEVLHYAGRLVTGTDP
jgi:hypothetical protein